jgi:hypothetical protein
MGCRTKIKYEKISKARPQDPKAAWPDRSWILGLNSFIRPLSATAFRGAVFRIAAGLAYLHDLDIEDKISACQRMIEIQHYRLVVDIFDHTREFAPFPSHEHEHLARNRFEL